MPHRAAQAAETSPQFVQDGRKKRCHLLRFVLHRVPPRPTRASVFLYAACVCVCFYKGLARREEGEKKKKVGKCLGLTAKQTSGLSV